MSSIWLDEPTPLLRFLARHERSNMSDVMEFAKTRTAEEYWDEATESDLLLKLLCIAGTRKGGPLPWKHCGLAMVEICELVLSYFNPASVPGIDVLNLCKKFLENPSRTLANKIARRATALTEDESIRNKSITLKSAWSVTEALAYAAFCVIRASVELSPVEYESLSEVDQRRLSKVLAKTYPTMDAERSVEDCYFKSAIDLLSWSLATIFEAFDDLSLAAIDAQFCKVIRKHISRPWDESLESAEFEKHNLFVKHLETIGVQESTAKLLLKQSPVVSWGDCENPLILTEWAARSLWKLASPASSKKTLTDAYEVAFRFFRNHYAIPEEVVTAAKAIVLNFKSLDPVGELLVHSNAVSELILEGLCHSRSTLTEKYCTKPYARELLGRVLKNNLPLPWTDLIPNPSVEISLLSKSAA